MAVISFGFVDVTVAIPKLCLPIIWLKETQKVVVANHQDLLLVIASQLTACLEPRHTSRGKQ
jgi:hypothetical protein